MPHSSMLPASLLASDLSPVRRRLSTDAVAPPQRFEYWLDMICAMYVQLECDGADNGEFFGDIEFSRLGSLDMTRLQSNAKRVRRTPSHIRRGSDDCCLVQVQREGRGLVCQDGRMAVLNPGDFVLYDSTRPYELMFDDEQHDVIVLRLPRALLETQLSNIEALTATTVKGGDATGLMLMSMVQTLGRDIDTLHPASALGVSDAITSIVAAGLRSLPGASAKQASNLSAFHVMRIKSLVLEQLRDPELSVASIAQAVKLSPDHLSRLFRSEPMPLSRLIWHQRLDACRRDLADPRLSERSVSEIAFSWGFNDAAHFSRSFREHSGMSPREFRAQH